MRVYHLKESTYYLFFKLNTCISSLLSGENNPKKTERVVVTMAIYQELLRAQTGLAKELICFGFDNKSFPNIGHETSRRCCETGSSTAK